MDDTHANINKSRGRVFAQGPAVKAHLQSLVVAFYDCPEAWGSSFGALGR